MLNSILGKKVGMTQIFDATGNIIPVTIISAGPCLVCDVRTKEKNGYNAVQLGFEEAKEKSLTKPELGNFKKKNLAPKKYIKEVKVNDISGFQIGQEIKADIFKAGDFVDVSGYTIGRGFAGGVKRYNFKGGPSSHGQSDRLRAPGSIGCQGFQRVIKGLRMAGHLGNEMVTTQKLEIVSVDAEKNIIVIKGCVPGSKKALVEISKTVKKVKPKQIQMSNKEKKAAGKAAGAAKPKEEKKK